MEGEVCDVVKKAFGKWKGGRGEGGARQNNLHLCNCQMLIHVFRLTLSVIMATEPDTQAHSSKVHVLAFTIFILNHNMCSGGGLVSV